MTDRTDGDDHDDDDDDGRQFATRRRVVAAAAATALAGAAGCLGDGGGGAGQSTPDATTPEHQTTTEPTTEHQTTAEPTTTTEEVQDRSFDGIYDDSYDDELHGLNRGQVETYNGRIEAEDYESFSHLLEDLNNEISGNFGINNDSQELTEHWKHAIHNDLEISSDEVRVLGRDTAGGGHYTAIFHKTTTATGSKTSHYHSKEKDHTSATTKPKTRSTSTTKQNADSGTSGTEATRRPSLQLIIQHLQI